MTTDQQAREAFETLLQNIIERARSVPEQERNVWLSETKQTLRGLAVNHGLNENDADTWAGQIEQEVRYRLAQEANVS
jgi:hypothetical protein